MEKKSAKESNFGERLKVDRIEALSDGVFAIAMTLIVLSLKFPDDFPSKPTDQEMAKGFFEVIPSLEKYFVSFLVLGMYWMRHQAQFTFIRYATRGLLYINIIFLMFVALIPATTNFLMTYNSNHIPLLLYLANNFIICLILVWHWYYITKMKPDLIVKDLPPPMIKLGFYMLSAACLLFLAAIIVSFWDLRISFMVLYLIAFIFPIYRIFEKKHQKNFKTIYD